MWAGEDSVKAWCVKVKVLWAGEDCVNIEVKHVVGW